MRKGKRIRDLQKRVRQILVNEWDPIGFPVPEDEYDSYIPGIVRLVLAGADRYRLSEHLHSLETVSMGLAGDRERCARIAARLQQFCGATHENP